MENSLEKFTSYMNENEPSETDSASLSFGFGSEIDDFDFGDVEDIGLFDVDNTVGDVLDFDQIDLFKPMRTTELKKEYIQKHIQPGYCPKGTREFKELEKHHYKGVTSEVYSKGCSVYLKFEGESYIIGKSNCSREDRYQLSSEGCIKMAELYSEDVKGKGSGLSFSNFLHSVVCMIFSKIENAILEPIEGNDITIMGDQGIKLTRTSMSVDMVDGLRIEITGNNYMSRKTNSHWVINKYLVYSLMVDDTLLLDKSRNEETLVNDYYFNKMDLADHSPYTSTFTKMHNLIRHVTKEQMEGLSQMLKCYYSNFKYDMEEFDDTDPKVVVDDLLKEGAKPQFDNTSKFPVLFRCLILPRPISNADLASIEVEAILFKDSSDARLAYENNRSTFHTLNHDFDIINNSKEKANFLPNRELTKDTIEDFMREKLLSYKVFQSIRVQNDLYPRITGGKGYYYSDFLNVGIAWNRKNKSSLCMNCIFYTFTHPGREEDVGQWSTTIEGGLTCYRSPTFVISKMDVDFSQVLYARCQTMFMSLFNSHGSKYSVMNDLEPKIMTYFSCCNGSSYQTSSLLDNMRFVTTGHIAGNDRKGLATRGLTTEGKYFRGCDFLCTKLLQSYVESDLNHGQTPLFNFPLSLMSLEKDIGLMINWKNRPCDHDTKCVSKLLKGVNDEYNNRKEIINWYERQTVFMEKMLNCGVSQKDYDDLIDSSPDFPAMCIPFVIGLCEVMKSDLQAASSTQIHSGFSIDSLVSDRGSISAKVENGVTNMKCSKVADELKNLVNELKPVGPFDLVNKVLEDDCDQIFLLRSKNGRGRREFATQTMRMRVKQCFLESLASTVSLALPDDQFLEPQKYCDMVSRFSTILNSKSTSEGTSEDRSFHCGNYQPEALSLAFYCMACVIQSGPLLLYSSITRTYTSRVVTLPPLYNGREHNDLLDKSCIGKTKLLQNKAVVSLPNVKLFYHMQQGMMSTAVGVINTLQASGLMKVAMEITDSIKDYYVITTQDDAGRAVEFLPEIDTSEPSNIIFDKPMGLLKLTSQVPNKKKHVHVKKIGAIEVNNIAITSSGMVSQEPIHAALVIQPLCGESPIEDLMNLISNSRSTIFWGDGPTIAMSALNYSLKIFQNKWLITNDQVERLKELRLIPLTIEELLEGFFPRSELALTSIIMSNREEDMPLIRNGTRSLYTTLRRKLTGKKPKHEEIVFKKYGLLNYDLKMATLYDSRNMKGRLRQVNARPMSIKVKQSKRDEFMNLFKLDVEGFINQELISDVKKYHEPPKMYATIMPMRRHHKLPTKMGSDLPITKPNMKLVIAKRLLGINYRELPNTIEESLISLSDEEFCKELVQIKNSNWKKGFTIPAPGGLPVVRFLQNKKWISPHVFNFGLLGDENPIVEKDKREFIFRGTHVKDLKPINWGSASLKLAKDTTKAFAIGILSNDIEDQTWAFYQRPKGKIDCINITNDITGAGCKTRLKTYERLGGNVTVLFKDDYSPLKIEGYNRCVAGLEGDRDAINNYGNYLRSNSDGFHVYARYMEEVQNSIIPGFLKKFCPDYSFYHDNCTEIEANRITIVGSLSISKLKYKYSHEGHVSVDITKQDLKMIHEDEDEFLD